MPAGRPSKYKPEFCQIIEDELAKGYGLAAACVALDIVKETAYEWANQYPDFSHAIKKGRQKSQKFWSKTLIDQSQKGGGIPTSSIFAMKNLFPEDWSDRKELSGPDGGPIPVEIDDRERAKILAQIIAKGTPSEGD